MLAGETDLPGELWQIKTSLAELYEERGDREEARQAFSGAAEVVQQLAAKIWDKELREGFLSAPHPCGACWGVEPKAREARQR